MMRRMMVVAGPPGGGKSTAFPVRGFGVEFFNADDRAAALNGGSYRSIPPEVRAVVNAEFERFVNDNIRAGTSLAFETTLRADITLRQAREARSRGFFVTMKYVAMGSFEQHLLRVVARAKGGGHAASTSLLRRIYESSMRNLAAALRELDEVEVFDNAAVGEPPRLVLSASGGKVNFVDPAVPAWLDAALTGTEFELPRPASSTDDQ